MRIGEWLQSIKSWIRKNPKKTIYIAIIIFILLAMGWKIGYHKFMMDVKNSVISSWTSIQKVASSF